MCYARTTAPHAGWVLKVTDPAVAKLEDYRRVRDLTEQARNLGFAIVTFTPTQLIGVDKSALEQWLKTEGNKVLRAMRQEHEGP